MIINRMAGGGGTSGGLPLFEYTGTYSIIDDGNKNWRIKFLTSGTLTLEKSMTVDVFMVGGGAGGSTTTARDSPYAGVGGGAGYTKTVCGIVLTTNAYTVQIAAGGRSGTTEGSNTAGGTTSAFEQSCGGGRADGSGGSGGIPKWTGFGDGQAGTDGGNGTRPGVTTYGQGTTTREFGEASGDMYAGGGGNCWGNYGGDGGGGNSADANIRSIYGFNGAPNTGGGGAGQNNSQTGGSGGSGIVVIRNHREAAA